MRVKFLADANFSRGIIKGLRRREPLVDFQTAEEANLSGKPDFEVLEIAASQGRVLVTHDRKTMPGAFGAFATERQSSGILNCSAESSCSRRN
jgi:predicted nuclease of predicted toxin-antitoxin system